MQTDLYDILGVGRHASFDEIKAAYRKLARQCHPDQNPGDTKAEERFKQISAAYQILSDPHKRQGYDRFGREMGDTGPTANTPGFEGFGDLFDILSSVFGGATQGMRDNLSRSRRGADYRVDLHVTFEEAAHGTLKTLGVPANKRCELCLGSGARPGTRPRTCTTCDGRGRVRLQQGFFSAVRPCPDCDGSGVYNPSPCVDCKGKGSFLVNEPLAIDVPPGVDEGQTLRWVGKGEPGKQGGQAGDLIAMVHLLHHDLFTRSGNDVACTVPISFTQAALGAKVEVPTLEGKVVMNIPPGTQTGKVFRLRHHGFPVLHAGRRGDQHVTVRVETPVKLTARQRELLEDFARESGEDSNPDGKSFFQRMKDKLG